MARLLIVAGIILIIAGMVMHYFKDIPFLGKLPGDIHIKREGFSLYFPITTSIVLSIILSLILFLINKFR